MSVGGGGFSTAIWSDMAATAASRAKFVASVVDWMRRYRADGVDMVRTGTHGPAACSC